MVDGHGNFGSVDGDSAAAMRYTEARMAPLALEMLRDIEKDTVPFRLNFDDTLKEPDMLPARFPNLLVNGAGGIAVGLATNIPPHNLREVIDATVALMDNPDISLDGLMELPARPGLPHRGRAARHRGDPQGLRDGHAASSPLRARVHVEDGLAGRKLLVITEIPYQVNKAAMLEKILKLSEEKKGALSCIYDIRDESDRTGMRAVIELKKDADAQKVLAYLLQVQRFADHLRREHGGHRRRQARAHGRSRPCIGYYIAPPEERRHPAHPLRPGPRPRPGRTSCEGLMIAVDNLDEVIALIRASKNPKEAKAGPHGPLRAGRRAGAGHPGHAPAAADQPGDCWP